MKTEIFNFDKQYEDLKFSNHNNMSPYDGPKFVRNALINCNIYYPIGL